MLADITAVPTTAASRFSTALLRAGRRCSRAAFVRVVGTLHTRASGSISSRLAEPRFPRSLPPSAPRTQS